MVRDLDINALRTFLAVAEHGNMTHAATLRNLTQSAVSQQIKKLETMLNAKLMLRQQGGVTLTEAGEQLLPHARAMVGRNDEAFAELTHSPIETEVRLGVPTDVVASLLPSVLGEFHKAHPQVHVTLISKSSDELRYMLDLGQIDIALTTDREADPKAHQLFCKPLIWIGAIGGTAHLKRPLPVAVGHPDCPFRKAATEVLQGTPWRAVTQVGSLEPVFATLLADMAVAPFLPGTLPYGAEEISDSLPDLPAFFLQLRRKCGRQSSAVNVLQNTLRAMIF